jgi:flagellin
MSLGVLNNLNAMYAENNLNNTSNSLSNVLNQLSSGSKINSGADDAAGLSLVNGLQANSVALSQSKTNAQEGVGLLTVADGALSQVTNLLNRAVTLATEASNGTLNASQDTAANQEYQSILSEISNIGSTTTYNGQAVFGSNKDIYTGDSSTQGASINSLNIHALSSSNVGDSGGVMAYSNGQSSVFINLSSNSKNAQSTDTLNSGGSSTINVNYLVKGANGAENPAATSITVGGSSGYANTASGLISAINGAGLGLTANFVTQAQAGVAGGGTQTGIQISGGLISVGVDPSASVTSGVLNPSEITNNQLTVGQTISVNVGSTNAATVTLDQTDNTLVGLAAKINSGFGGSGGVTATVMYDSGGTATSLKLADNTNTGGALTVTTTAANVVPNALTAGSIISAASDPTGVIFAAGATGAVGVKGTASLSVAGAGSNIPAQALTGSITLSNGANTQTYTMGTGGSDSTVGNVTTLSAAHSTLSGLATAISGNLGASAVASSSGIAIASTATGSSITAGASTLAAVLSATAQTNVAGIAATTGTPGVTSLSMNGDNNGFTAGAGVANTLTGTFSVTVGGVTTAITMGAGALYAGNALTTAATTADSLVAGIHTNRAAMGFDAAIVGGKIVLTSQNVNSPIVVSANALTGVSPTFTLAGSPAAPTILAQSSVNITAGNGVPAAGMGSLTQSGDLLTGSITINNGGTAKTFVMGNNLGVVGNTINLTTANSTMAGLMAAMNAQTGATNLVATLDQTAGAGLSGLTLTANNAGAANILVTANSLNSASSMTFTTPASGSGSQLQSGVLGLTDSGVLSSAPGASASNALDGTLSGSISITSIVNGVTVTDTFTMGGSAASDTATSFNTGGNTLKSLIDSINKAGAVTGNLDVIATQDAATGGIFLQSKVAGDTGLAMDATGLTNTLAFANSAATTPTFTPGKVTLANTSNAGAINDRADLLTSGTSLQLTNSASGVATTFTMGGVTGAGVIGVGSNTTPGSETMGALIDAINGSNLSLHAAINIATGNLEISSTAANGAGTVTVGTNTITDAFSTSAATTTLGTAATAATAATATINTTAGMSTTGNDALSGQLILKNGAGSAVTFNLNSAATSSGTNVEIGAGSSTLNGLVLAINQNVATLGLTASINSSTGALQLQSTTTGAGAITVGGTGLTDATGEAFTAGAVGIASKQSSGTINLVGGSNNFALRDTLTGNITLSNGSNTKTFVLGGASAGVSGNTVTLAAGHSTVADLKAAIENNLNVSSVINGGSLVLTSNVASTDTIAMGANNLSDTLGHAAATASLGTFTSQSDQVSGQLNYSVGNTAYDLGSTSGMNVTQLMNKINFGNVAGTGPANANGVTASWVPSGNGTFGSIQLTSNTFGETGNITNHSVGTTINDLGTNASLSFSGGRAYNVGVSNVAGTGVYDSSTQSAPTDINSNLTSSAGSSSGVATISYSDGAGVSLSATDLTNQSDAQSALSALNKAITAVAAQDGYVGAQINTLNAVSSVLSTQQQNVTAAQNAVQATDYAQAASNMSKYQILSQTGISALAQANSMQQEVTKLLQ